MGQAGADTGSAALSLLRSMSTSPALGGKETWVFVLGLLLNSFLEPLLPSSTQFL